MQYLFIIALLGFGLYELITTIIILPSRKSLKSVKRLQEQKKLTDDLKEFFIEPFSKNIAKLIRLDKIRREKLSRNLQRVGIKETPELYYANAIVISLWIALIGLLWVLVGIPFLTIVFIVVAVIIFGDNVGVVNKELKKTDEAIRRDLPKFVMIYSHSRGDNVQLVDIVEKYRRTACEEFHYDLDLLIMDLKTSNEEAALMDFADRINIVQINNFVNILVGGIKGDDVSMSLYLLENEMQVQMRENKKRIIQELPEKVKGATYATGIMLVLLVLTPIIIDMTKSLSMFN